ncbi:MAG: ABC transporter substrate-binding protein [Methanomicrobiales archaeon]|nr:ABC transporter substrate-binding protein [Methanomicrobiales archaeon]
MDKKKKNIIISGIAIFLVIILVSFCLHDTTPIETVGATRIITDMGGNQVQIPVKVNSAVITCCGGASQEFAVLGAQDIVIGLPKKCISDNLRTIIPKFADTPDVGSFSDLNLEDLLALNPDIVVASAGASAKEGNGRIKAAGIPVVEIYTGGATLETLLDEYEMMGEVLGKEEVAHKLVSYWNEKLAFVKGRTSHIPVSERKTVYYMTGGILTACRGKWGEELIGAAGGINVVNTLPSGSDISVEEILKWNPDVIITRSNGEASYNVEGVLSNPQLSDIKAVKDKEVYDGPVGTFWWDRPSPEAALAVLWMGTTLYPEEFEDIIIEEEVRSFYLEYYNYDLTDDEIRDILTPALRGHTKK